MRLRRYTPSRRGSPEVAYSRSLLIADVLAGLTVAVVLVPQAIAYAQLAGMPPDVGLRAAIVAPLVAAPLVASPYLQTGPVALTALLTFGGLAGLAAPGSVTWIGLGAALAVAVGLVRLAIGVGRVGDLVAALISEPVARGFAMGAALTIAASQMPIAAGVALTTDNAVARLLEVLTSPSAWMLSSLALAAIGVVVPLLARGVSPLLPGVAIAVAGGLVWVAVFGPAGATVGDISLAIDQPFAGIGLADLGQLVVPALVIAIVGFAEVTTIARRYATEDRTRWDASHEFVSQGAANVAAGVVGGMPVGGSFSRTALAHRAGARTRFSGAVAGAAALAVVPFADVFARLPLALLAGVVIGAVAPLLDPRGLLALARVSRVQAVVAAVVLARTLAFSPHVEYAVIIGVGLSIGVHLWRELNDVVVSEAERDGTIVLAPSGVLWFGNAHRIDGALLRALEAHPSATSVAIDLTGVGRLDVTGAFALRHLLDDARRAGLQASVTAVSPAAGRMAYRVLDVAPPSTGDRR